MTELIHHLTSADYDRALPPEAPYLPPDYAIDGFIHCTQDPAVLVHVANIFMKGVAGEVLVLAIDPERVTSEIRLEAPSPPAPADSPLFGVMFPHIYGPLNRDAIVEVRTVMRAADGTFLKI
jgi:uncharacterized protein (DUF952 family)